MVKTKILKLSKGTGQVTIYCCSCKFEYQNTDMIEISFYGGQKHHKHFCPPCFLVFYQRFKESLLFSFLN